jgi:S-adenosylmethionine:tRNA ribosyltransferase-isomerase
MKNVIFTAILSFGLLLMNIVSLRQTNAMKLSHFQFNLPKELLAEYPAENRDESRLMVVNREKKTIEHKTFKDVIDYFGDGDVLILNNTKVFPARLYGNKEKTGARIEVFLLRELNSEQRFGMY